MTSIPITIGKSCNIGFDVFLESPCRIYNNVSLSRIEVGAFSYISPRCSIHFMSIGRYCSIGNGTQILSIHPTEALSTSPIFYQDVFAQPFKRKDKIQFENLKKTIIGNDVWIGADVKIKSGVTVGDGSIIGAGSIVTKDVADYSIVAGSPAREIRQRFSPEIAERLKILKWWNYDVFNLDLSWEQPGAAINQIEKLIEIGALAENSLQIYEIINSDGKLTARIKN